MGGTNPLVPLVMFYSSTMIIFSMYGGAFASAPAYLADLFGTKFVGGIHGRLLTCWSVSGILGTRMMMFLRTRSEHQAIADIATKVPEEKFKEAFGSTTSELQVLIDAKTVTISKLMELAPPGTIDPTPFLYNNTMFFSASLLAIAAIANSRIRPVSDRYKMTKEEASKLL